jgi:hypothetical protein
VFDERTTELGTKLYPDLDEYIDRNYVCEKREEEYGDAFFGTAMVGSAPDEEREIRRRLRSAARLFGRTAVDDLYEAEEDDAFGEAIRERLKHTEDPFGVYLLYLIRQKGMTNAQVYNNALITKQAFAKLNKDPKKYHPDKITALRYCVGAKLNIDETKDLLARAGYALSPSDKRDIIFAYFITNEVYDLIDIDIQMEEYGLPCMIK